MCFITGVSNLLITNDLIFKRFLSHTFGHTFSPSSPKTQKHKENCDFSVFAATILIYLNLQRQSQIRFLYPVLGVEGSAICEKNHSVAVEPKPVSVQVVERVGLVASGFQFCTRQGGSIG